MLFYQWIVRQIILAKRAGLGAESVKRAAKRADNAYGFVFLFGIVTRESAGVFRSLDVINAVTFAVGYLL